MFFLATAILIGSLVQLICAGMIWPDRLQRSLALFVSAYRHYKEIKAGTEKPKPQKRPTPAGFTISEALPSDHCHHGVPLAKKCPLCAKEKHS